MPAKLRLARHGSKGKPFYHIVVADSRAPRDGRYIERIGNYNPTTHPATIDIDFDKALDWIQKGAVPTDTCRNLLSLKGVMYKKHLLEGVKKGAFSEEEAENRFNTWIKEKEANQEAQIKKLLKSKEDASKKKLADEEKLNEDRKAELAKKKLAAIQKEEKAEKASAKPNNDEVVAESSGSVDVEEIADETPAADSAE